ncbi:MAG TPA: IPT/TIG domain-containing protein, partial [Bryocella sp.]|nr:IPT/TIG domain-containing protein [Bryocella sp.]
MKTLFRTLGRTALPCLLFVCLVGCSSGSGPSSPVTPTPAISSVTPNSIQANQATPFSVTITGSGFISTSQVEVNGSAVNSTYLSATQLQAQIPASLAVSGAQLVITVMNGSIFSGSGSSSDTVTVTNPAPAITSLSPSSAVINAGSVTVTVTGSGFIPTTTLTMSGTPHALSYVSSTQLTVALTSSDLASTGSLSFVASNPAPGGGSSPAAAFSVVNPTPAISSINPGSATAGGGDLTLAVQGSGFLPASSVLWNTTPLATTFVSATQLTAVVPAAAIAANATAQVTVTSPSPGGGASSAAAFTVNASAPVLTSISPHTVKLNQAATITITGSGFTPNSIVQWNGTNASTTFVNATTLQVALAASDLSAVATGKLSVLTPAPGGGTSGTLPLVVTSLPIPSISAISFGTDSTSSACSQIEFIATGTNFFSGNMSFQVAGLTIRTSGTGTTQVGLLPAGFSAQASNTTFTAVSTFGGISSEPFTPPASTPAVLAICAAPNGATIFPGSSFAATFTPSSLNVTSPASLTSLTLPSGVTASSSLPLGLATTGSRMTFQASASLPAGSISIPFSAGAGTLTATGVISFTASTSTPPSFFISSPLVRQLAIPIGGSGKILFQSLGNGFPAADYTVDLAVSGLPAGTTATVTPSTIIPGDSFTVNVTAASNAPVTQNTTITVTGTPSSTAPSATTTFLLDVTQAPGNLPNNRSDFVSTAATPYAMIYNRAQDLIYVSNPSWNRIDIISNANRKLLQSVPVRGPSAIDLSADGTTLWIGTQSQQIYAMNTTSLALTSYMAPGLTGIYSNQTSPYKWQDTGLFSLADNTLLLYVTPQPGSGINYVAVWNPSTGVITPLTSSSVYIQSFYFNLRSGDHTKVYGSSVNSS